MTSSPKNILNNTKNWIADFVIKLSLCPFAYISFDTDKIYYEVSSSSDLQSNLAEIYHLIVKLREELEWSNAFYILQKSISFDDLLKLKDVIDTFLEETKLESEFQTVAFHPEFRFESEGKNHPGNYVNRSPYPMLHILRAKEVERATSTIEDPGAIPNMNKEKLEKLGYDYLCKSLESYQK